MAAFGAHRSRRDFEERLSLYERARRDSPWNPVKDINWDRASTLPDHLKAVAISCAGAGTYTEEVGLLTASRLVLELDDAPVRLCLAKQILDEAKHSEAFARYYHKFALEAELPPPPHGTALMLEKFANVKDPTCLFIIHTLVEGMALDQFSLLCDAMAADQLGDIYRYVMRDEALHVAMGLDYLQFAFSHARSDDVTEKFEWCKANIFVTARYSAELCAWMAEISHRTASDVKQMFESRHDKRLKQIQSWILQE
jgi:ribonucleotide reductase beta subunit family protein with ferritin-like domain